MPFTAEITGMPDAVSHDVQYPMHGTHVDTSAHCGGGVPGHAANGEHRSEANARIMIVLQVFMDVDVDMNIVMEDMDSDPEFSEVPNGYQLLCLDQSHTLPTPSILKNRAHVPPAQLLHNELDKLMPSPAPLPVGTWEAMVFTIQSPF